MSSNPHFDSRLVTLDKEQSSFNYSDLKFIYIPEDDDSEDGDEEFEGEE